MMEPIQSTQLSLRLAGDASAWWLLLVLPALVVAAWLLYRRELASLARWRRLGLLGLRLLLLTCLGLALFRPSLIVRRILTYPGRILLIVDDSQSMTASDTAMPAAAALRLARTLKPPADPQGQPWHEMALLAQSAVAQLRQFQRFSQQAPRTQESFWDQASLAQGEFNQRLSRLSELAGSAPKLAERDQQTFAQLRSDLEQLQAQAAPFFSGDQQPGAAQFDRVCRGLATAADGLWALQAARDQLALAQADSPLWPAVGQIRNRSRLDLLGQLLHEQRGRLAELAPGQNLQVVHLSTASVSPLADLPAGALPDRPGQTDLVGGLRKIVEDPSDFPLTAVLLLSDGRDIQARPPAPLQQLLSRQQAPLHVAAVGASQEPLDLAILGAVAPPFAVVGEELRLKLKVKVAQTQPSEVQVNVVQDGQSVARAQVTLEPGPQQLISLPLTLSKPGLFRFTAELAPAAVDAFPQRNNRSDFAIEARPDKVRVLLLDYQPRWQTRFALNILQRLDYVDLNSIIVLVSKDGVLTRGQRKGTWPQDAATLGLYDLVLVGNVPEDLLTAQEWGDLAALAQAGKCVGLLAPGRESSYRKQLGLPAISSAPAATTAPAEEATDDQGLLAPLRLAAAGQFHPITQALAAALPLAPTPTAPALLADLETLLDDTRAQQPLLSLRPAGRGKLFLLDDAQLWKKLNPTLLAAHGQVFSNLVSWAVQGRFPAAGDHPDQWLALDQRVYRRSAGLQLWAPADRAGSIIEAVTQGRVAAQATLTATGPGAALSRAAFADLPAADWTFRLQGQPQAVTAQVLLLDDDAELQVLARNDVLLSHLAGATGGQVRELAELERFFPELELKTRVQKHETIWQVWDSATLLTLLALLLTLEWVSRKLLGLV